MQKLILIDAYAMIFRAYYGFINSPRINSRGQNTSAAFGFVTMLEDLLRNEKPDFLAVVFDPAGGTFRHKAFPTYKAQRDATPEDIKWAVPVIQNIIAAYGIAMVEVAGFEADDVIGTIAHRVASDEVEVRMLTPDKDYAQLVRQHVLMCRPGRGAAAMELLDEKAVCEKYGIQRPEQVIDLLGLMGDSVDNIPGCPGVGEKTAVKLIEQFGDIETLLNNTQQLKGAQRKKVEENAQQIRDSKWLATIKTDVPFDFQIEDFSIPPANKEALRGIFEEHEFRSFIARYLDGATTTQSASTAATAGAASAEPNLFDTDSETSNSKITTTSTNPSANNGSKTRSEDEGLFGGSLNHLDNTAHNYQLVEGEAAAKELCQTLLKHERVGFDTETTSLDALDAQLVGMSFAVENGRAWYVAIPTEWEQAKLMVEALRPVLESERIEKVGQNLKYDLSVLLNYGVELKAPMFDTMLAHYVLQPEQRHNLDHLAEHYLRYRCIPIEQIIGTGRSQRNMAELPATEICNYACEDADVALRLYHVLNEDLKAEEAMGVFRDIEMPLMPVLARMERTGVRLDTTALEETQNNMLQRLQQLEKEIFELAGEDFLLTSPKQVGEVLFEKLQIATKAKKTKTGQYSTSEEVLEALRSKHPIVEKILDHRGLKKLLSTYVEALPKLIKNSTQRIHSSFNQAVTATGRLSSSNPNLQNIPVRGEDGREIRRAFVPEDGCVFFSADYSQIELRIMAHLSADEAMIADFREGRDIHAATAARVFGKNIDEVTRDERRAAKTANFGIIYGISAFGLSERMGVSRSEAKELIDNYFTTYPRVKAYMDECIAKARERGFISTQFGRRRYLADINSANATVRGFAERNAINAPIQGTAADIIKRAMIAIDSRLNREGWKARMILQVHDELNFSVPNNELENVRKIVIEEMERAYEMAVPLVAECGVGQNWLEAH